MTAVGDRLLIAHADGAHRALGRLPDGIKTSSRRVATTTRIACGTDHTVPIWALDR